MPFSLATGQDGASGAASPLSAHAGRRVWAWRPVVGRVLLLVLGLSVPVLLLELLLHAGGTLAPGEYQTTSLTASSEAFTRENIPNRAGWKQSNEYRVHVRVNSKGLRGPEIPYEKPRGVFRALVLGDSFTFGAQVDEEETFVARLGQQLTRAAGRGWIEHDEVETINAGVDGWSTVNELAWLKAEGLRYQPDLVLLMYYTGNDPGENYDQIKALQRTIDRSGPEPSSSVQDLRRSLTGVSAVYSLLESGVISKLSGDADPVDAPEIATAKARRSTDPERKERGWEISADLVREMRLLCEERNIRFVLIGIPSVEHVLDVERPPTQVRTMGDSAGALTITLLQPFRAVSTELREELYFLKDRHWTRDGHDVAARHVAGQLIDAEIFGRMARPR